MATDSSDDIAALRLEIERLRADLEAAKTQGFISTPPSATWASDVQSPPASQPTVTPDPVETMSGENRMLLWIGAGLLLLLLLFLMTTCGGSGAEAPPNAAEAAADAAAADAKAAAAAASSDIPAPQPEKVEPTPGAQWSYDQSDEAMGGTTKTACVTSNDQISLDFPYHPASMQFCIRKSPKYGLDTYTAINGDGQILCSSYSRCRIRVRFDDKVAQIWPGTDAADGSSNIVFLRRSAGLVEAIKRAKTMRIELEFYQNGVQSVTYDVEGLKWP